MAQQTRVRRSGICVLLPSVAHGNIPRLPLQLRSIHYSSPALVKLLNIGARGSAFIFLSDGVPSLEVLIQQGVRDHNPSEVGAVDRIMVPYQDGASEPVFDGSPLYGRMRNMQYRSSQAIRFLGAGKGRKLG
ncbi:hypothetical protein B0H19DRAFT_1074493 [Mycena capillaripes]|nr:hypothetical protein B0H19DRAFT_1074493 [Mycena capillaripes]